MKEQNAQSLSISGSERQQLNTLGDCAPNDLEQCLPEPLRQLLHLKQSTEEDLPEYFNRLADIASECPYDAGVEPIYLRRFISGIDGDVEQYFVKQWLQSSHFSLENTRDAVIVLSRWSNANEEAPKSIPVTTYEDQTTPPKRPSAKRNTTGKTSTLCIEPDHTLISPSSQQQTSHKEISALQIRPNVTTRAAAATKEKKLAKANRPLLPKEIDLDESASRPKTTKAKGACKSKSQRSRKDKQVQVTTGDCQQDEIVGRVKANKRGSKRAREGNDDILTEQPQTPGDKNQHGETVPDMRKRARTNAYVANVDEVYPSSPPVITQVLQSSPFGEHQRRLARKPSLVQAKASKRGPSLGLNEGGFLQPAATKQKLARTAR